MIGSDGRNFFNLCVMRGIFTYDKKEPPNSDKSEFGGFHHSPTLCVLSERQFSARRAHFLKDTFECRKVLLFVHSDALDHCGDLFVFYATENFGIGVYRILFRGDVVEDHLLRIFGIRDRAGEK